MIDYFVHISILFSIYAILSLSLNLVVGYAGLVSVAQAAFYGIGAYTTAILTATLGFNFFISVIVGILVAAILGFLAGLVFSKFRGDYYVLATLAFNVIIHSIFINWYDLTHGPLGIPGVLKPNLFGLSFSPNLLFFILSLLFLVAVYGVSRFIAQSSFGRALKAIREDESALKVFGYKTSVFKLSVFVASASLAAVAGSLFASYLTFVDPSTFLLTESIFILSIIILGGLGNLKGSLLGAFILVLLPELLRFVGLPDGIAAQIRQALYGLILIVLMLYRPQGLMGEYKL